MCLSKALFLNRKQYEILSYATQSENKIFNIKILFSKEKSLFPIQEKNFNKY